MSWFFDNNLLDMRKTISFILLLLLAPSWALAQNVSVSGALIGNGSYATLTDAFAAINSGAQSGATITVSILNDTYEGTGTAVLNAGAWTGISIVPVGQPRSILGATTAGQPMINLNGADQVTFDGLLGGQRGLTLFNTTNSTTAGTSTIRFAAAAQNNSLLHCKVYGASRTATNVEGGNVVFISASNGGNSYNGIHDCELGAGNTDLPTKAIFSQGSSTVANMNANNAVVGCHFYDCFGATQTSNTISLQGGNDTWTIQNNRFYQNGIRTKTNASSHYDIWISGNRNLFHDVSNNIFGTHPTAIPAYSQFEFAGAGAAYIPLHLSSSSTLGTNSITNNVVQDIQIQVAAASGSASVFYGISFSSKGWLTGNRVGSTTDPNSIVITSGLSGEAVAYAIRGGSDQTIDFNQIGGIQVNSVAGGSASFFGISMFSSSGTSYINRNTIGYANAPVQLHGTAANGNMRAISVTAGSTNISDNVVAYLYNDQPSTTSLAVYNNVGIYAESGSLGQGQVARNHVHSIVVSDLSAATGLAGIQSNKVGQIEGNSVHSLRLDTQNPAAALTGIDLMLGDPNVYNNMVRLGFTSAGVPITKGIPIFGIHNKTGHPAIDHNSIYIGGSGVADSADTYALYSQTGGLSRILNNIFYNARSNGSGTGFHFAISHGGFPSAMPVSNGNDLLADGVGGKIGRVSGADLANIFDWRLHTLGDFNSISHNPNFLNPTGDALLGDLHIGSITPVEGAGVSGIPLSLDFDSQSRNTLTPIDIGADAGNFTQLVVQQPEAHLTGNALQIVDGDVTPVAADGTDFGVVFTCSSTAVVRTFVLRNIGNANLNIGSITVSGSSAFTVQPPASTTLLPGQTLNIVVQFMPVTPGMINATVTVLCNDADEGTYTFAVRGAFGADNQAPTAQCLPIPAPIAANGIAIVNAAVLGAGSTDNCAITSYTASPAQFTCAQMGPQAVTLTVSDALGNTATCSSTVNVIDQLAPQALCQNSSLTLGVGGTAQLTPAAIDGGSTDNCGIDTSWVSPSTFSCAQLGANTVQLIVRDAAGLVGNCTATVTVTESQAPIALCQPATLLLDNAGQASLAPAQLDAGSTDNCGGVNLALNQGLFTCADVGVRPVVLIVTDGSGNAATCSTQVTVQDLVPPVLTCADFTLAIPGSSPATLTPAMVGTAADACGIASYSLSQTQFSCVDVGTSPVSLIAVDAHGNSDTCSILLTVTSTAPLALLISTSPVDSCGYHVACAGQHTASATVSAGGACGPYTYVWSNGQTGATATGLGAGTYSVTVQAPGGQQAVQSVTLIAPQPLSLSLSTTPSCFNSNTGSLSALGSGGQACQSYSYLWSNGATSPSLGGLGPGNYTVTLTDAAGCSTQTSMFVTVWSTPTLTITNNQGNLIATSGFVGYQWYDASGPIPGATAQQYTPLSSGIYHVVATDFNGCEWTSADFPLTVVGNAAAGWEAVTLYPNPSAGVFRFAMGQAVAGPVWLSVTDLSGKELLREALTVLENGRAFDLSGIAAGVYLVELRTEDGVRRRFRWLRE
jgi:hypothetical protein